MAGQCKVRTPAGAMCSRSGLGEGAVQEGSWTSEMPCVECMQIWRLHACACAGLTPAVRASFSFLAFSILSFVISAEQLQMKLALFCAGIKG